MESTRIDRWLWAVRVHKTRSAATAACSGGHVKVNGTAAKPAAKIKVGDTVEVQLGPRRRILEVVQILEKRVGAPLAAEALIDRSPPPPPPEMSAPLLIRDRGTGRPTKRDRRAIDKMRRGDS